MLSTGSLKFNLIFNQKPVNKIKKKILENKCVLEFFRGSFTLLGSYWFHENVSWT